MKNKNSVWCTINGILGYFIGVVYCFTLILIPVAVYCFIGARRYIEWSELTESQLASKKSSLKNWAIFFSIVGFPIGLFSLVPACLVQNNVVVTSVGEPNGENPETAEVKHEEQNKETESVEDASKTIEKLENLKNEGLITEEEYQRAKDEVLRKTK